MRPSHLALAAFAALTLGAAPRPEDVATTQTLGGPARALTYIATDKPIYKAGETVYVRGFVLDAASHKPFGDGHSPQLEIKGPKGELATTGQTRIQDTTFGFSWVVPEGSAGGEYTVNVKYPWNGLAPATRKFDVRVYRAPRLKSQIVFARDGYGPGSQVSATLESIRAEGGVPTGAKVTAVARVDEAEVARAACTLDAKGRCTVGFKLPPAIERGEGTLSFTIEDGGVIETAAKTIPILMQSVNVAFFPEGGDLVAGLPSRVYVEARLPSQKPADIAGVILDAAGKVVAELRTEHEGRGRFSFTPAAVGKYVLQVTEPALKKTVPLPEVVKAGAVIEAAADVTGATDPVKVKVAWTGDRVVKVKLSKREVELDAQTVDAGKQKGAALSLNAKDADGVLVVTVTEKDGTPLAERLVFRAPKKLIEVQVVADKPRYAPGAPVSLKVKTSLDGKPVSAVVGVTVTDDSVLEMVEKREQAPTLLPMVFLETDVKELADAHVYLDPKNPKSTLAVDRLLGTQGWRRFAFVRFNQFLTEHQDPARRVLALLDQTRAVAVSETVALGGVRLRAEPQRKGGAGPPPRPAPPAAPRGAPPPQVAAVKPAPVAKAQPPANAPAPPPAQPMARIERPREAEKQIMAGKRAWADDEMMMGDEDAAFGHFVVVRQFAHVVRPDRKPNDRLDFAETLYWAAGVRTDAKGEATVAFGMSDSVTAYQVSVGAVSNAGVLGEGSLKIESVRPFYVEPKLPLEVTSGDLVRLPIALVNGTDGKLINATVSLDTKADVRFTAPKGVELGADARVRQVVELTIGNASRPADLKLTATAQTFEDVVTRQLNVKPRGFPTQLAFGGLLKPNGSVTHTLVIPADLVAGSVTTTVAAFPSPAGNLNQSLAAMVQEPSGCFEQTSSTTYPMTMALQYFQSHSGVDPKLVADAQDKLDRGYKRLTGYECKSKGYEWFGEDPGHEALTAYGLLHFTDMSKVRSVDQTMLVNTRGWLLKQRDGRGGFERKRRALHTWVEDREVSDAYIIWALLESGGKSGLDAELGRIREIAKSTKNSNALALAANALLLAGDSGAATLAMEKLAARQDPKTGAVSGSTGSIVGSSGESLTIETTALATIAWLKSPAFTLNVENAIKSLSESCKGGRYGATQSTVLALRAIVAYDAAKSKGLKPGSVTVFVDGKRMGTPAKFDGTTQGALMLTDIAEVLTPGTHQVELKLEGGSPIPYSLAAKFNRVKPDSSKDTQVSLEVSLAKSALTEGDVVEAIARVTNLTDAAIPTVVAIVGLPGGLEPRHDQLKELVKQKTIDAYEVLGRDVVLYWRGMLAKEQRRVPLSLIAAVPGKYTGPASRAYLYYGDEHKTWVAGLGADIAAKK